MYIVPLGEAYDLVAGFEYTLDENLKLIDELKKTGGDQKLIGRLESTSIDLIEATVFILENAEKSASVVISNLDCISENTTSRMKELGIDEEAF